MTFKYRPDFKCWWPDYDREPERCYALVQRRVSDADIVLSLTAGRECVVQAGGHVGFWPIRLARHFARVFTFEPDNVLYQCLVLNAGQTQNVICSPAALGAQVGSSALHRKGSAGSSVIDATGEQPVNMLTIDSLDLKACDAIILDVEGSEVDVLRGAVKTIKKFSPVIHLEQSNADEQDAFLEMLGYKFVFKIHSDRLFRKPRS